MDEYKELIRKRIKEKFGTIENFSKHVNIPRTTINFILKNGVNSSNFGMVSKILKELDIYTKDDVPVVIDGQLKDFIKLYNSLDNMGKHAVNSVAQTEYRRIYSDNLQDAVIAAYSGITSGKPLTEDEKTILDLVEKIKNDK